MVKPTKRCSLLSPSAHSVLMPSITDTSREESFIVLNVQPPGLKGDGYRLRLKINTEASSNTLLLRTIQHMYGSKADTNNLLKSADVKPIAYNGEEIRCLGRIDMICQVKRLANYYILRSLCARPSCCRDYQNARNSNWSPYT